ncbi:DUF6056 family protein [Escherichia coli]|uniref:DUF6056 family protein n=1 Tax=Escherichia coli TaxID=562 RepID=UPI0019344029|nr:DUF6056 family protein [Escherichia coli]MBL7528481.1 hypothetical protein [Escherichia coli]MDZ7220798.1 DUF6056 family protein [Escherichia coli]
MVNNINRCIYIVSGFLISIYAITFSIFPLSGEDFALTKRFINNGLLTRIYYSVGRSVRQIENWNARLGEQLAIFNLSMPPIFFIIISIASFIILSYILFRIFNNDNENIFIGIGVSIISIYAFWPGFEVFFWKTANAGYLQPMLITLSVMFLYLKNDYIERMNNKFYAIYLFACILVGLSFENVPVALFISFLLYCFIRNTASARRIYPMIFILIGWVTLILAPSTIKRKEFYQHVLHYKGMSVDYIITRLIDVINVFITTSWLLLAVFACAISYLIYKNKAKLNIWLCIIAAILVDGSMVMSPYTEARAFMFSWCIMTAVIVHATYLMIKQEKKSHHVIFALIVTLSISSSLLTLKASVSYAAQDSVRESIIDTARFNGLCDNGVSVKRISTPYTYRYINNREHWFFGNLDQVSTFYDCNITK